MRNGLVCGSEEEEEEKEEEEEEKKEEEEEDQGETWQGRIINKLRTALSMSENTVCNRD